MAFGEAMQSLTQIGAHDPRVILKAIPLDHVQHRETNRGGHRVTTKGIEVSGAAQLLDHCRAHCQTRQRMPRSHGLTHGYDVRYDAVTLEAPHPITGSCKA